MALLDVTTGLPQMVRGPTLLGFPLKQITLMTVRILYSNGVAVQTASTQPEG